MQNLFGKAQGNGMIAYVETFLLAIGAGLGISIGGTVYLSMDNKLAGALLFAVGLYMICVHGLNLYTGKIGYLLDQKPIYLVSLLLIWLGNFAGTWLGAQAVLLTRVSTLAEKANDLCQTKLNDTPLSILLLSFFCGILMYVAVDGYKKTLNPILLFVCVSVFILCGFEHCVANMFYFSLAEVWSVKTFLYLLLMTFGNSIGGLLIPIFRLPERIGQNRK